MNFIVGVSAINATDNPGSGCGIARSLLEINPQPEIIGLSYDINDPGHYISNLFSNSFILPYPNRSWEITKSSIIEVKQKTGLNFLIPALDVELPMLIENQQDLIDLKIGTILPTKEQFNLRDKANLPKLAQDLNCLCPQTTAVYSIDDLINFLHQKNQFPAIIKGQYYSAYTVHNIENAILRATEISALWGFPILIQEKIEGQEVNIIGLSNLEGSLRASVSIKKQLTTQLNKIWTAVTIRNEDLDKICQIFTSKTKWRGPFELELMVNQNGIYLIEINPRFPSWSYFATALGINLPQMMLQIHAKGDCEAKFNYDLGKLFIRYPAEFVTDLNSFQNLVSKKNRNGL